MLCLEVIELHSEHDFDSVRPCWHALLERSPAHTIFQTLEFHLAWHRAFSNGRGLHFAIVYDQAVPVLALPIILTHKTALNPLWASAELAGSENYASDFLFPIGDPSSIALDFLVQELSRRYQPSVFRSRNLSGKESFPAALESAFRRCHAFTVLSSPQSAPFIDVTNTAHCNALHGKGKGRRRIRYFEELPGFKFLTYCDPAECQSVLPHLFSVHKKRWNSLGQSSQFEKEDQRYFYSTLIELLAPLGRIHISALYSEDVLAAMHFGFQYRAVRYWYKPTFDPDLKKRAAGEVLLLLNIRDAQRLGLEVLHLGAGNEPYKYHFASGDEPLFTLEAFIGPVAKSLAHGKELARKLKRTFVSTEAK